MNSNLYNVIKGQERLILYSINIDQQIMVFRLKLRHNYS